MKSLNVSLVELRGSVFNKDIAQKSEVDNKLKFLLFTIMIGYKMTVEHSEQCIFKDDEYSR